MAPDPDYYEGPVCYADGWHWSVTTDTGDKQRRLAIAQAAVDHAPTDEAAEAAAAELAEVEAHPHEMPDRRLVLEDRFVGADGETYTGPVVHGAEGTDPTTPDGGALKIETRYRFAADGDRSWAERKHRQFVAVDLGDGGGGISVSPDELEEIKQFLAEKRGQ